MLPFKKILCPTDYSSAADKAVEAAAELAAHFDSEILLLHVVAPIPVIGGSATMQELEVTAKKQLEDTARKLEARGLKAHFAVRGGNPAEEIVRMAGEKNADLIVIPNQVHSTLDRVLFGSVTEKVIRLARCPVLTIASNQSGTKGEEIPPEIREKDTKKEKATPKKRKQRGR